MCSAGQVLVGNWATARSLLLVFQNLPQRTSNPNLKSYRMRNCFSSAISSTLNAGRVDSVRVLILVKLQGSRACISNSNDYFAVKGQNPIVEIAEGSNMGLPQSSRAVVA